MTAKELLRIALNPPQDDMIFPFSSGEEDPAKCWVSLMLRPVVPFSGRLYQENRWKSDSLLPVDVWQILILLESIFGNGGDPFSRK